MAGATQMYEKGTFASVDIKFLADAHICAYEDPFSYGRYICFNKIVSNAEDVVNLAQSLRHLIPFPDRYREISYFSVIKITEDSVSSRFKLGFLPIDILSLAIMSQ